MERAEQKQKQKEAGTAELSSHVGDETLDWEDRNPWCCGPRTALDLNDLPIPCSARPACIMNPDLLKFSQVSLL